jgi:glycosyltransferase involved in cell wall biosynthesis
VDRHEQPHGRAGPAATACREARTVLYWAIDFVPDRFGEGSPLTRAYDALDRWVCVRADGRFEVSRPALDGRTERHGLDPATMAPARVVPMGAWLSRLPAAADDAHRRRRIVFLGHLVPRMGVGRLIEALGVLRDRGVPFQAQIAGRGPSEAELRAQTTAAGLDEVVRFVGFIDDHREVERFVADGSVAVAPYATDMPNFTRYADPSKLRAYTAAGLPVVLTPVPPNAGELAERGGAQVVPYDAEAIAGALEAALEPAEWLRRHGDALRYSSSFDWGRLLPEALAGVGYG